MKKLIIAAFAVAVAVGAQASSVDWKATSVWGIDGKNIGTKAADAGWTAVVSFWAWDATAKEGLGDWVFAGTSSDNTSAMSTFGETWKGAANNTKYQAQLVITDDKGNTLTSEKAAFTTDETATYGAINFTDGTKFAEKTSKLPEKGTSAPYGWVAAPEPTSGLLLLIGVGALALRRRRA